VVVVGGLVYIAGLISDATSLPLALSLEGILCLAAAALAPAAR
jgi:hypothetical protein